MALILSGTALVALTSAPGPGAGLCSKQWAGPEPHVSAADSGLAVSLGATAITNDGGTLMRIGSPLVNPGEALVQRVLRSTATLARPSARHATARPSTASKSVPAPSDGKTTPTQTQRFQPVGDLATALAKFLDDPILGLQIPARSVLAGRTSK